MHARTGPLLIASLAISSASAGAQTDLEAPQGNVFHQMVTWSPDGSSLAYTELDTEGEYAPDKWTMKVVGLDGSEPRTIGRSSLYLSWSPDGQWIACDLRSNPARFTIWLVRPDGSGRGHLSTSPNSDSAPAFSPDGRLIAYSSKLEDENIEIFVMRADGSEPRRLTNDPARDYNPQWSPDGREIVFYREIGDGNDQIFVIDLDGTNERRITDGSGLNIFPSFLPDGRIAYSRADQTGGDRLVVVSAHGSSPRPIGPPMIHYARWSPDGSRIAFVAGSYPRSAIYVMDADGANIRKVVN